MIDIKKVIKGLEECTGKGHCTECPYGKESQTLSCKKMLADVLSVVKEQEARELTFDEWREWKANPKRDPICMLWENDISPIWILDPKDVHEPALLMGKLKLFTGKPTFEQCKKVKWEKPTYANRQPAYICDPDKNQSCTKEGCMIFRFCRCTTNKEFAKTGENGKPIVAIRSDLYGEG